MALEQYAYLADIIAAIAVIASLIYLARELRQNTNAIRVSSSDNFVEFNFKLNSAVAMNREFAELWMKGMSDFDSLDAVEKQRLVMFDFQAIAGWHNWFNQRQEKLISDAHWIELTGTFEIFGQRQAIREAWKMFKHIYKEPYQEFMAQYLESDLVTTDA